jgi:hypothetical protein
MPGPGNLGRFPSGTVRGWLETGVAGNNRTLVLTMMAWIRSESTGDPNSISGDKTVPWINYHCPHTIDLARLLRAFLGCPVFADEAKCASVIGVHLTVQNFSMYYYTEVDGKTKEEQDKIQEYYVIDPFQAIINQYTKRQLSEGSDGSYLGGVGEVHRGVPAVRSRRWHDEVHSAAARKGEGHPDRRRGSGSL